jgi:hypothetical protein
LTDEFDIAVIGNGPAGALVALALAERSADLRISLVSGDTEIGGRELDLVLPMRLAGSFIALLESLVVRTWPAFLVNFSGTSAPVDEAVWLLDPVQLWLQLLERSTPVRLLPGCADVVRTEPGLQCNGQPIITGTVVDLRHLSLPPRSTQIVGAADLGDLSRPVYADLAEGGATYDCLQYVPLGDDRVVINRFHATTAFAEGDGQGRSGTIDDLPITRYYADIAALCDQLLTAG